MKKKSKIDPKKALEESANNLRTSAEYGFENNTSYDATDIFNKYITDEFYKSIDKLKQIILKNATTYSSISTSKELVYNGVSPMVQGINNFISDPSREKTHMSSTTDPLTFDESYLYKKIKLIESINTPRASFIHAGTEKEQIINKYDDNQCIRDVFFHITYSQKTSKGKQAAQIKDYNDYTIKTYSLFYAYYLLRNIDDILNYTLTFRVYNTLSTEMEDICYIIEECFDNDEDIKKEQILFSYLLERGTGLGFKYLLYNYALKYNKEILSKKELQNKYDSMDMYLHYMTSFKLVCLFPDESFFEEASKTVQLLMEYRSIAVQENTDNLSEEDIYLAFIRKFKEIINELYVYQATAVSAKEEPVDFEPLNFIFEKKGDRAYNHVKLWNDVQRYVNAFVMCENPSNRFDIDLQDNSESYETVITQLNSIKYQIASLKSAYRML